MDMHAMISDLDIIGDIVAGGVGAYGGLGDVDILGAGGFDSSIEEALSGPNPNAASAAAGMAEARKIDKAAVLVRQQALRSLAYQPAGVPPTTFTAPGGPFTQQINLTVTRPFKPYELIIGSEIAPFFRVDNSTVNGRNQLATAAPVPASAFSEASLRSKFRWETVNPSSALVLTITMTDTTTTRIFTCCFQGAALMR